MIGPIVPRPQNISRPVTVKARIVLARSSRQRYRAFGEHRDTGTNLGTDREYTEQRRDPSVDLYHYNARSYDQHLGRFVQPERGKVHLEMFSRISAPVQTFALDHVAVDPAAWTPTLAIYTAYCNWANPQGRKPCGEDVFGARLRMQFPLAQRKQRMVDGLKRWGYEGIKLTPEGEAVLKG